MALNAFGIIYLGGNPDPAFVVRLRHFHDLPAGRQSFNEIKAGGGKPAGVGFVFRPWAVLPQARFKRVELGEISRAGVQAERRADGALSRYDIGAPSRFQGHRLFWIHLPGIWEIGALSDGERFASGISQGEAGDDDFLFVGAGGEDFYVFLVGIFGESASG